MRFLLVAAMALLLSGCFGVPAGAADFGDTASIRYVALDADTRQPISWGLDTVPTTGADPESYNALALRSRVAAAFDGEVPSTLQPFFVTGASGQLEPVVKSTFDQAIINSNMAMNFALSAQVTLGAGNSGLGFGLEQGLVGAMPNETLRIVSRDDPTLDFNTQVTSDRWLDAAQPISQNIPRATFEQNLGEPTVGQVFPYNNLFEAEVTGFDDNEVMADLLITDGEEFDASVVGANVVARVLGDEYRFELVLVPGAVFSITSSPFQPAPLGLADGTYRSIGTEGEEVVWDYTTVQGDLIGRDIEFIVRVTEVTRAEPTMLGENYGARESPVLAPFTGGADGHSHGDHGHDDHSHDDGHGHTH